MNATSLLPSVAPSAPGPRSGAVATPGANEGDRGGKSFEQVLGERPEPGRPSGIASKPGERGKVERKAATTKAATRDGAPDEAEKGNPLNQKSPSGEAPAAVLPAAWMIVPPTPPAPLPVEAVTSQGGKNPNAPDDAVRAALANAASVGGTTGALAANEAVPATNPGVDPDASPAPQNGIPQPTAATPGPRDETARQVLAGEALSKNPIFRLNPGAVKDSEPKGRQKLSQDAPAAQPTAAKTPTGDAGLAPALEAVMSVHELGAVPRVSDEGHGTVAAQQGFGMKSSPQQVETARGTEQKVPTREHDSAVPKAELGVFAGQGGLIRPIISSDFVAPLHPIRTVSAAERAEKVANAIRGEVVTMRRLQPDMLSVVLKPDAGTEILVQMTNKAGEVHAHVRCERGDFDGLNAQWGDLQQSLAAQGVKLAPLQPSSHASATGDSTASLSHGQGGGGARGDQRNPGAPTFSMTETAPGKPRASTRGTATTPAAKPLAGTAWQKWA